jgi:hypothetical protein
MLIVVIVLGALMAAQQGHRCRRAAKPGTRPLPTAAGAGKALGIFFGDLTQFGDSKGADRFIQTGDHFTTHGDVRTFRGSKLTTNVVVAWAGCAARGRRKSRRAVLSLMHGTEVCDTRLETMHDKLESTTTGVDRKTISGHRLSPIAINHF